MTPRRLGAREQAIAACGAPKHADSRVRVSVRKAVSAAPPRELSIIRTRDGGQTVSEGNITTPLLGLFVGWHGVRGLFRDPAALELDWRRSPPTPQPIDGTITDLCGATAAIVARPGAFEDFAACAAGQ